MRRLLFLGLLGFGGCQCLQPVSEERDAGMTSDAGSDAGTPECARASDCVPLVAPRECGFGAGAPSRSCFDGRCVFDCEGTRTCSTAIGSCLSCDGGTQCNAASCAYVDDGATGRIYRSCTAGSSESLGTFRVRTGRARPATSRSSTRTAACSAASISSGTSAPARRG